MDSMVKHICKIFDDLLITKNKEKIQHSLQHLKSIKDLCTNDEDKVLVQKRIDFVENPDKVIRKELQKKAYYMFDKHYDDREDVFLF